MWISALALTLMVTVTPSMAITPTVGVIADDLADYSQWISAHKDLWTGSQVVQILNAHGVQARLMHKDELTPEGLSRFEAVLVATDHTYPERGPWGGPVAKALVEYVRRGGVYAMPIGIPHWSSKDLDTGKLYTGHFEDIFGFKGATASPGRGPLMLTRQGSELGLSDPGPLNARPVRTMDYPERAVLVWSADYVPCLSAVP